MKVHIHPRLDPEERKALEELLLANGCEIVDELEQLENIKDASDDCVETDTDAGGDAAEGDASAETAPGAPKPTCIVVLVPGLSEDNLQPELTRAIQAGCRVLGVWGPGSSGDVSPLQDYGSDTVPWDNQRILDAICGIPQHRDPNDTPLCPPKPITGGC